MFIELAATHPIYYFGYQISRGCPGFDGGREIA